MTRELALTLAASVALTAAIVIGHFAFYQPPACEPQPFGLPCPASSR